MLRFLRFAAVAGVAAVAALLLVAPAGADDKAPTDKEIKEVRDKAIAFLRAKQGKDGSFASRVGPGVTALVIAGLVRSDVPADDKMLTGALAYLGKQVKKDGGIYGQGLQNYTTCIAMLAFKEANADGKYDTILKNAAAYLKKLQHDDAANAEFSVGGLGYGEKTKGRPDLSNTQYFVEAMIAAGVPKDDPAIKRALKFIQRCQNLADKENGNDQKWAEKATEADKGGFTYVADKDDSKHVTPDGGLRSLGGMTYAGLKSFLYAGVDKKDVRVQSAVKWVRNNYTLEENPGMKQAGLYYYYQTFAKAMDALGEEPFKDAKGKEHYWRKELFEALKKRQTKDGSWVNKDDNQFMESDLALATSFALLSLSYTKAKK